MKKNNWDMVRLFESINKTKIKGTLTESFESEQEHIDNEMGINPPNPIDDPSYDFKEMLDSYLETALWAEDHEDGELNGKTIHDIDTQSKVDAIKDIQNFISIAGKEASEELRSYESDKQIGHNLWLSRNGHGAGFFDDNNDKLQDIARNMGPKDVYVGDDGKIYFS